MKAASLVPWVPPFLSKYLVVIADPRRQSTDLYKAIQYLEAQSSSSSSETSMASQTIVISADSVRDMMAWNKRNNHHGTIGDTTNTNTNTNSHPVMVRMFEDPSLQWMKTYNCIHDLDRWSMSVLIFDSSGIIRHHSREVDPSRVYQLVSDVVATIEKED
jgi:alkyl hydroperoxide reductase subunit AhpC